VSISGEKDALRAQLRARLSQSDPAENAACDVRITLQVLSLPAFQAAERIFAYCSVVPEVDTHAILAQARRRGKTVALPVTQPDGQMRFARYDGALVPGRFGIPEPPRSAPSSSASPASANGTAASLLPSAAPVTEPSHRRAWPSAEST